jgi:diguanylate cyclase (GGDEF)-like protein
VVPGAWAKSASDSTKYVAPPPTPSKSGRSGTPARLAHTILAHLPFGVAVIDRDASLLFWNEHAGRLLGLPSPKAADRPKLTDILGAIVNLSPPQREGIVNFVSTHIASGDRAEPDSCLRIGLARGRRFAIQVQGIGVDRWLLVIDDGAMAPSSGSTNPMQGGPVAWLDPLTGLGNRRHFNKVLRDLTENASPASGHALLMIDLDRFQAVNVGLGHPVGDALLCLVAQRLRRELRDDDTVVRLGGDEFVILIPNGHYAEALATRVVNVLSRPFIVEGQTASIGASVGIARFPEHGSSADDLNRHAEMALQEAKNAGRGTWRTFEPSMATQALARHALESSLRRSLALALGELSLHYLPRSKAARQTLCGFEASVHWNHSGLGNVPSETFVPLAEESGSIVALGEWVVKSACLTAMQWPAPLSVALNVLPQQLQQGDLLVESVQSALHASGLPPARLELNIPEKCLLLPGTQVLQTLHRLRGAGVRVGVSDFGTGSASISLLQSFPFSSIKIDRNFITGLGTSGHEAAPLIRSVTAVAAELGIPVIAEGVETAEQAASAEALGCTDILGFPPSRPMPAAEIEGFLRRCDSTMTSV